MAGAYSWASSIPGAIAREHPVSDSHRFGWLGAVAFFLGGCIVAFLVPRFWQEGGSFPAWVVQQPDKSRLTFQADFRPPRSFTVNSTDKTEILVFQVERPKVLPRPIHVLGSYPVSIKNLSNRAYAVSYVIYAYDAQNRRLDEASDSVTVSARETVLRQLEFSHPLSVDARTFAYFHLIGEIDH
jgi:hypothetical protein